MTPAGAFAATSTRRVLRATPLRRRDARKQAARDARSDQPKMNMQPVPMQSYIMNQFSPPLGAPSAPLLRHATGSHACFMSVDASASALPSGRWVRCSAALVLASLSAQQMVVRVAESALSVAPQAASAVGDGHQRRAPVRASRDRAVSAFCMPTGEEQFGVVEHLQK